MENITPAVDAVNMWKCTEHENIKGDAQEYLAFHVVVFLLLGPALVHDSRGHRASDSPPRNVSYFCNSSYFLFSYC